VSLNLCIITSYFYRNILQFFLPLLLDSFASLIGILNNNQVSSLFLFSIQYLVLLPKILENSLFNNMYVL